MNDNRISSGNPFLHAAQQLQTTGKTQRAEKSAAPARSPRARLNFIPDDDSLLALIAEALHSLSRGRYWDRGAILNIVV
jgi:hypothetical protein